MKQIYLPKPFYRGQRVRPGDLSALAAEKTKLLDLWETLQLLGLSSAEAAARVGAARSTLYRWRSRFKRAGPRGLEEGSRAPRRRRRPTWSAELAEALLALRERHPRWGKDKLAVLLRRQGWTVSVSMTGRILRCLRQNGRLREPRRSYVSARKRRPKRTYAIRKPREYVPIAPGDIVQVDTLDLRPLPGLVLKQFTARDVVSRWDVVEVFSSATATNATEFLKAMEERFPFPVRAVQVDGGSEFMAGFEEACRAQGIRQFVLPPRSPKLNGCVERAQRTHTEEFWECYEDDLDLDKVRPALRDWENLYNTYRPHQSLAGLTPKEYLAKCHPEAACN
jgi:putative transposase